MIAFTGKKYLPLVPSHSEDAAQEQVGVLDVELAIGVEQDSVDEDVVCVCNA